MPSESSHGAGTRQPVIFGGRRIPSLWQRNLKDGTVVYEAKLRIGGKNKRIVLDARTATEAIRELEALRVDRARGTIETNPLVNPTVAEVADECLEHMQIRVGISDERRRYSQSTVDNYRYQTNQFIAPLIGHRPVAGLTTPDMRRFITDLAAAKTAYGKPLAPGSQHRMIGTLSAFLTYATKLGYIDRNPCLDLARGERASRRRQTEPRYLSADEIERLLNASTGTYRGMFACMAYGALRASEVFGLLWSDVDFKTDTITITGQLSRRGRVRVPAKTASSAAPVPMVPALKRELVAHRARMAERGLQFVRAEKFVFVTSHFKTSKGLPFENRNVYKTIRLVADKAGLAPEGAEPIGLHDLRHSAIALAIQSGAPITEVAEFARHSSPATTLTTYAGLANDDRGGAVRRMIAAGFGA